MDEKVFNLTKQTGSDKSPLLEIVGRQICRPTDLVTRMVAWNIQGETLTIKVEKMDGKLSDLIDGDYQLTDPTIDPDNFADQLLDFFEKLHQFGLTSSVSLLPSEEIKYNRDNQTFTFKFDDFLDCFTLDPFDPMSNSTMSFEFDVFIFASEAWNATNKHRFSRFTSPNGPEIRQNTIFHLAPNLEERVSAIPKSSIKMIFENALAKRNDTVPPHTDVSIDNQFASELYQNIKKIPEVNRIYQYYLTKDPVHDKLLLFYLGSFYPMLHNSGFPENLNEVNMLLEIIEKLPFPYSLEYTLNP